MAGDTEMAEGRGAVDRFWLGATSGYSLAAGLVLGWFSVQFSGMHEVYAEFGAELPALPRLVTHPFYARAVPVAVVLLVVLGNVWLQRRPKALLILLVATTILATVAVVISYWGAIMPFTALSENISAD